MTSSERDEKLDFNALVERCAGSDRKEQGRFLVKVVMKVMIEQYGKGERIPDSLGLPEIEEFAKKDANTACMILTAIYSFVAESLLNDSCYMLDIRSWVIAYMQSELERRQKIQREAGI